MQMLNSELSRISSPDISEYIRRNEQVWRQRYEGEAKGNTWRYNSYYIELLKEDQTYNNYA